MKRARDVRRKRGGRVPAIRVVIVAGGASSEPQYLRGFMKLFGNKLLSVNIVGGVGDPRAVVQRAIDERKDAHADRLGTKDIIWAMFDRDIHARYDEAVDLARRSGIPTAITNPCFELWAIFHYQDQDAPIHRHECQRLLGRLCQGYARRGNKIFDDIDTIQRGYHDAAERGKTSLARREAEGIPTGNPSTSVHCLTECLRTGVMARKDQ